MNKLAFASTGAGGHVEGLAIGDHRAMSHHQQIRHVAIALGQEAVAITRRGNYTAPSGNLIEIADQVRAARNGTQAYPPEAEMPALAAGSFVTEIAVENESTLAVAVGCSTKVTTPPCSISRRRIILVVVFWSAPAPKKKRWRIPRSFMNVSSGTPCTTTGKGAPTIHSTPTTRCTRSRCPCFAAGAANC